METANDSPRESTNNNVPGSGSVDRASNESRSNPNDQGLTLRRSSRVNKNVPPKRLGDWLI